MRYAVLVVIMLGSTVRGEDQELNDWYAREEIDTLGNTTNPPATDAPLTDAPLTDSPDGFSYVVKYCSGNSDCNSDGDDNGFCNLFQYKCSCSNGYQAQVIDGVPMYWGCYQEYRKVLVSFAWSSGVCSNGRVSIKARRVVLDAFRSHLGAMSVPRLTFTCGSIIAQGTALVSALDTGLVDTLETAVVDAVAADADVLAELGTDLTAVAFVQPSTAPPNPVDPGTVAETPTPSDLNGNFTECTLDNAEEAYEFETNVCTAVQCSLFYVLEQQNGRQVCTRTTTDTVQVCMSDNECTASADLTVCQLPTDTTANGTCITATPVSTKTTELVKEATSVGDWCSSDSDCRLTGMYQESTCTLSSTIGNSCTCPSTNTSGFSYPDALVKLCMEDGITTVVVIIAIDYASGNIANFTGTTVTQFSTAVQAVLGSISSAGAFGIQTSSGLTLYAVVTAEIAKLAEFASGAKFLHLEINAQVSTFGRQASILALSDLGDATGSSTSSGSQCSISHATQTILDGNNACQALACETGYSRTFATTYTCTSDATRDSDDDLTSAEKAAIGVAVGAAVLIAVLVVFVMTCGKKSDAPEVGAEKHEPADDTVV